MPGVAIGISLPIGFAGMPSRANNLVFTVSAYPVNPTSSDVPFGAALVLNSDTTVTLAGGGAAGTVLVTAANFTGIAIAEVKQGYSFNFGEINQNGVYKASETCGVLRQGTVIVRCGRGTPTAGGPVYIRTVLNGTFPSSFIGDIEALSDTTNSVLLTSLSWASNRIDANLMAELRVRVINN